MTDIVSVRVEISADTLEVLRQVVTEELIGMRMVDNCEKGDSIEPDSVTETCVTAEIVTDEYGCGRVLGEEEDADVMDVDVSEVVRYVLDCIGKVVDVVEILAADGLVMMINVDVYVALLLPSS